MCGIAGLFFKRRPDRALLASFTDAVNLHHRDRGPDDFGVLQVTDRLYFFHNRLSIIDPSRARQPMADDKGAITFNGEIYNFAELKYPAETYTLASDTEVLLKGLNREGERFLERTRCMFAFGYYNYGSAEVVLARDRFGLKQLYYIETDEVFAFASTLKPLMRLSKAETDENAVFDYYLNRAVKAPRTLFSDIRQLEAGQLLRFDTRRGRPVSVRRWWSPREVARTAKDETKVLEEVDCLLRRAVSARLVSDVPVGMFLSGGVDSGLIAAIASETIPNLEAFSVSMPDQGLDETRYARAIADRYGLKHNVLVADPDRFLAGIEDWALLQDDVVADPSALMLYQLSQLARDRGFKVMLCGEGADEIFGGYNAQSRHVLSLRYHSIFRLLSPAAGLIDQAIAVNPKLRQFVKQLINGPSFYGTAVIFEPVVLEQLFRCRFRQPLPVQGLGDAIRLDIADRLPNDLLTRTDRATMGASIEARVPFLAHDLVNYAVSISEDLLIRGHTQKYVLKKLAERYLPRSAIYRRKIGFDLPLAKWLRGPLRPMFWDLLESSWQRGLIDLGFIRKIAGLHQAGTIDAADKMWAFMMLELNHRALIKLRKAETPVAYAGLELAAAM
jgi:asparagine synthase (glutamine-hydrolysing)